MNKAEIKQIILEEIEAKIEEMADEIDDNINNRELVDPLATILSIAGGGDEIEGPEYEDLYGADVPPFISPKDYALRKLAYAEKQGKIDPDYLDNFEYIWRLQNDPVRRLTRLFQSYFYYLLGKKKELYNNTIFNLID